jgi:hypothetical protein
MCFGGNDAADDAKREAAQAREEARVAEETRQANVRAGQDRIGGAFAQFDEPYFANFRQDYVNSQNPEIETQYGKAKDQLTAGLARRGVLDSTIGANAFGELEEKRNNARTKIADDASNQAGTFRNQIEKTKSDLIALNTASADPNMIEARARGEATSLVAPKATGSLGDLFGSVLAPYAAFQRASIYSPNRGSSYGFAPPTSGAGTGSVVG